MRTTNKFNWYLSELTQLRKTKAKKEDSIEKQKIKNVEVKEMIESKIKQNLA